MRKTYLSLFLSIFLASLVFAVIDGFSIISITSQDGNLVVGIDSYLQDDEVTNTFVSVFSDGSKTIILDSSNSYTDIILGDSLINKSQNGPIIGNNIEFSCGTCDVADFSDAVSQIGGGAVLCNYSKSTPLKIVENDDKLCMRDVLTDTKYDLDLLTWAAKGNCWDADNGTSCANSANQVAYIRIGKTIFVDESGLSELPSSISINDKSLLIGDEYILDIFIESVLDEYDDDMIFTYNSEEEMIFNITVFSTEPIINDSQDEPGLKFKDLDIKVGSKTDSNIQDKEDYNIDRKAKPGEKIIFDMNIENLLDVEIEEVFVVITIEELDEGDDVEEESDTDYIRAGKAADFKLDFEIPIKLDDERYDITIEVEGKETDSGKMHSLTKNLVLVIDKESHDLRIMDAYLKYEILSCRRSTELSVVVLDLGKNSEDEVKITATNHELGIDFEEYNNGDIELETGIDDSEYLVIVPVNVEDAIAGDYIIDIMVYRDSNKLEDSKTVTLIVEECREGIDPVDTPIKEQEEGVDIILKPAENKGIKSQKASVDESSWFINYKLEILIAFGVAIIVLIMIAFSL